MKLFRLLDLKKIDEIVDRIRDWLLGRGFNFLPQLILTTMQVDVEASFGVVIVHAEAAEVHAESLVQWGLKRGFRARQAVKLDRL